MKEVKLKVKGTKVGDIEFAYNNFIDAKEGLIFSKNKVNEVISDSVFNTKQKKGVVDSVCIRKDHANTTLRFNSIKDLKRLVKYMESRVKVVKSINKSVKGKFPVMGNFSPDLTIILSSDKE